MITYSKRTALTAAILARIYSLFRGRATALPDQPKKILAINLTGNVGDMIFGTPVYRAVKEQLPDTHITVIGRKHNQHTLAYNNDVNDYLVCPKTMWGLYKLIKSVQADYAFLYTPSAQEIALMLLGNAKAVGIFTTEHGKRETKSFKLVKSLCINIPYETGKNVAEQNQKLISPLGVQSADTEKYLGFSDEGKRDIENFYKEHGTHLGKDLVISMAPGAGTKIKQWPADRFAKLADYLSEKYRVPIYVVGGPGDTEEYEAMAAAVSDKTRVVSCLHHSIDELKAFLSMATIIIANDSAPIYVAEAFGKKTVTIVGPTDENEHPPTGPDHRIVKADDRGNPALKSARAADHEYSDEKAREQIERVRVEDVIAAAEELIGQ